MAQDIGAGDVIAALAFQAGGGLILGFAAGYAAKKALKIALIIVGFFTAVLLGLEYYGVITVNWDKLALLVEKAISGAEAATASLKAYVISQLPFAGSFLAGFALGFRYG